MNQPFARGLQLMAIKFWGKTIDFVQVQLPGDVGASECSNEGGITFDFEAINAEGITALLRGVGEAVAAAENQFLFRCQGVGAQRHDDAIEVARSRVEVAAGGIQVEEVKVIDINDRFRWRTNLPSPTSNQGGSRVNNRLISSDNLGCPFLNPGAQLVPKQFP